jgi:hypothetical protein
VYSNCVSSFTSAEASRSISEDGRHVSNDNDTKSKIFGCKANRLLIVRNFFVLIVLARANTGVDHTGYVETR